MTVLTQMTEVLHFRNDANHYNYNSELFLKNLALLRVNARKLELKREQFAVLEMINAVIDMIHREDQVFAYKYNDELYINTKTPKDGYHSSEELIGQGFSQSTWDNMERVILWKNTYNEFSVLPK